MDPLLVGGMLLTGGGIALGVWRRFRANAPRRALGGGRAVALAEAQPGAPIVIVGRARVLGEPLHGPATGRACVAYRVCVADLAGTRIIDETRAQDFVVEDEGGRALVRTAEHLELLLVMDATRRSGFLDDATPGQMALLRRHWREGADDFGMPRSLQYEEGALEPGERVAVLGVGRVEAAPEAGDGAYRSRAAWLVVAATPECPLRVSDDPKALAGVGASLASA